MADEEEGKKQKHVTSPHAQSLMALFSQQQPQSDSSQQNIEIQVESHPLTSIEHDDQKTSNSNLRQSNFALYQGDDYATSYLTGRSWDPTALRQEIAMDSSADEKLPTPFLQSSQGHVGTIVGVVFPILQYFLNILLFTRLPFIVGYAGIGQTLLIIFMSCIASLITLTSLSAICSNGTIAGGGLYYIISRTLGKDHGVTTMILYYLAQGIGTSVQILGAVEVLLFLVPQLDLGSYFVNNVAYGTALTFIACLPVVVVTYWPIRDRKIDRSKFIRQVRFQFGVFSFGIRTLTVLSIIIGLLAASRYSYSFVTAIPHTSFESNFKSNYTGDDIYGNPGSQTYMQLFSIFFPCASGIVGGLARISDLKDPAKSVPIGSFSATFGAIVVYVILTLLVGAVFTGQYLRTLRPVEGLQFAILAWPVREVALVGLLFCTMSLALLNFCIVPRILMSIANDDVLPIFKHLKEKNPLKTLLITFLAVEIFILVGPLNTVVAPAASLAYMICFVVINISTALLSILKYPQWRPQYKYYHWLISLFGAALAIVYMFLISYVTALVIFVVVAMLYFYVVYAGAQVEWGTGIYALNLSLAQKRLSVLEEKNFKRQGQTNWRPQVLSFVEFDSNGQVRDDVLLCFISQLRKAGGLTVLASTLQADISKTSSKKIIDQCKDSLQVVMRNFSIKGFAQVLAGISLLDTQLLAIQSIGIGVLRPNTVILNLPEYIKDKQAYYKLAKSVVAQDMALILLKSDRKDPFPHNNQQMSSTIDVYWITHDGGILTLLPYLLKKHRVWKNCQLRIFCVANPEDDQATILKDLKLLLQKFRIDAVAEVVQLDQSYDISEYTYVKTIRMQNRHELLEALGHSELNLMLTPPNKIKDHLFPVLPERKNSRPNKRKDEYLDSALKLNMLMRRYSQNASLVFCSLPTPTSNQIAEDYLDYVNQLVHGLPRVILVKGSGLEVVTAYF